MLICRQLQLRPRPQRQVDCHTNRHKSSYHFPFNSWPFLRPTGLQVLACRTLQFYWLLNSNSNNLLTFRTEALVLAHKRHVA